MEHEIRKHIHNVIAEIGSKKKSIWKKTGEILLEILIIIFAVSFAVFMERQREHNHEQKEAKEFLLGLKTDLQNDITEMENDKKVYRLCSKFLTYLAKEFQPNIDSINRYEAAIWTNTRLLINNGRYEGFKASGKMNTIANIELRNSILDLYQESINALTNSTTTYIDSKKAAEKMVIENNGNFVSLVLQNKIFKQHCLRLSYIDEIIMRYDRTIKDSQKIINLIDKEYLAQ